MLPGGDGRELSRSGKGPVAMGASASAWPGPVHCSPGGWNGQDVFWWMIANLPGTCFKSGPGRGRYPVYDPGARGNACQERQ